MAQPALLAGMAAFAASAAHAQTVGGPPDFPCGAFGEVDFTANIGAVSDYRWAGLSFTGGSPAIQGGFDAESSSGWSAGVFASTIEETNGAEFELDLYGSKAFELGETELEVGAAMVLFPGGESMSLGVAQASVSRAIGPVDATLAVNYAWEQATLGDEDSVYVTANATTPVGRIAGLPLTLEATVGYEDGPFAIEDTKIDWTLSMTVEVDEVEIGVSYVDTSLEDDLGDPTWVFSVTRTFTL